MNRITRLTFLISYDLPLLLMKQKKDINSVKVFTPKEIDMVITLTSLIEDTFNLLLTAFPLLNVFFPPPCIFDAKHGETS